MRDSLTSGVGAVSSADIAVPEHEREVEFYSSVLTSGGAPLWREDLMNNHGMPVIGLGARTPEYADLPLQWMPHIQVADVAASVASAVSLGGRTLMHGKDEHGASQWAVLLDLNGAAFGVIPVVPPESIPKTGQDASAHAGGMGCIAWLELRVPDTLATRDFYQQVVGWSGRMVEADDSVGRLAGYEMDAGGMATAGIQEGRDRDGQLPAVWIIYLPVDDLAESLRRVREREGQILETTAGANDGYARAVVQDPVGVCWGLVSG